jgi:HAD superfamily hydrolase (TIGR01459 family)
MARAAAMRLLPSLDALPRRPRALLCDIWGVVHNGRGPFGPACDALARFRASGGLVVLISNVPKPRDPIPGQLERLGVRGDAWDAIVTSGDAIRAELAPRAPGPFYKIGPPFDADLWAGLGLERTNVLAEAAFFAISGLNDDRVETPEDYAPLLAEARARRLDLLCANPDIVVQRGDQLSWCAGAVARDYSAIGGRVIMAGKPYAPIYDLAYRELARLAGAPIDTGDILAIGDGVITDVKGANAQGLDCVFIASGIHGADLVRDGVLSIDALAAALAAEGAHAAYVMDALR